MKIYTWGTVVILLLAGSVQFCFCHEHCCMIWADPGPPVWSYYVESDSFWTTPLIGLGLENLCGDVESFSVPPGYKGEFRFGTLFIENISTSDTCADVDISFSVTAPLCVNGPVDYYCGDFYLDTFGPIKLLPTPPAPTPTFAPTISVLSFKSVSILILIPFFLICLFVCAIMIRKS